MQAELVNLKARLRCCRAAAPLKQVRDELLLGVLRRLRCCRAAAPLKLHERHGEGVGVAETPLLSSSGPIEARCPSGCAARRRPRLRCCRAAAPLKQASLLGAPLVGGGTPLLSSSGPIEARKIATSTIPSMTTPLLSSSGPIEAPAAGTAS